MLFNGPMVRAILDGRKTQTRRVVRMPHGYWETSPNGLVPAPVGCPFGKPGDRLWARETWAPHSDYPDANRAVYRADPGSEYDAERWRPSIHMPRWACRLVLEITDVRVERLHAISEADCAAEGVTRDTEPCDHTRRSCADVGCLGPTYRSSFAELWTSTGGDWSTNPWVWVISFRRIDDGGK